jgi:thiopurine S-methyltransferase
MILDETYWQERYENDTAAWDLGHASRPLKTFIDNLKDKEISILLPGAGYGHEVLYLYNQGFTNVTVVDVASASLEHLASKLPRDHGYTLLHQDFFAHTGSYDLILEQTFYCALELRFRESYFKHMHRLLNKNGMLVGLLFHFEQKKPGPPFTCTPEEYKRMAQSYFTICSLEPCTISEPSRAGKELFLQLQKQADGD